MEKQFTTEQKNEILNGAEIYHAVLEFCKATHQTFCAATALEIAAKKSGANQVDIYEFVCGAITF